ncbi:hypothetical protein [Agrobacterium sp. 22-226-1]
MELKDLIAEIESRLDANAYTNGDIVFADRQARVLALLLPGGIANLDVPSLDDVLGADKIAPSADTSITSNSQVKANYSYSRAVNGLGAAAETTAAQYRRTNESRYSRLMDVVMLELARIVQDDLDQSAAAYQPLTAAFKGSKKDLKAAYNSAKSKIDALNVAAAVIKAFGRLMAAV